MRRACALAGLPLRQVEGIWALAMFAVALTAWCLLQASRKGL
ncbi:hypothetical protein ABT095_20690 [Kitasatospora sp. NPDC002227]